jgi:cephalosporin hydroxylase
MRETPIDVQASIGTFRKFAGYTQNHRDLDIWKSADDMARYRHILEATCPEVVVETGSKWGGFAAWMADTFGVDVVTVDIAAPSVAAQSWPRVTVVTGNSVSAAAIGQVRALAGGRRCMVSLDSDHHLEHVRAEIRAYAPLVSAGCYLVVEDALADIVHPDEARRFGARIPEEGGPLPAIEAELVGAAGWVRDLEVEGMSPVSHSPFGFWRRVS